MENIHLTFLLDEDLKPAFVEQFIRACFEHGVSTQQDGSLEPVRFIGKATDYDFAEMATDDAIDELKRSGLGTIAVWYDDIDLLLGFYRRSRIATGVPAITLSIDSYYFSRKRREQYAQRIVTLAAFVAQASKSPLAYGYEDLQIEYEQDFPLDLPAEELPSQVDHLMWLTILGPKIVDRLGRARVLSTPAYRVEELENGGVLIVLTEHPTAADQSSDARIEAEAHLGFDGGSR